MRHSSTFADLKIGQQFDFINDNGLSSFFERCEKISPRKYHAIRDHRMVYRIGSVYAAVYHVCPAKQQ